jgi:hypothetical protein
MARDKATQRNIDGSDLINYPNKRVRNNDGSGNGTPVDESMYGDIHEFHAKIMRDAKTLYNGLPDNNNNGYQLYDSLMLLAGKNDLITNITAFSEDTVLAPIPLNSLKIGETLQFKANFNSNILFTKIKGSDNAIKALVILGGFQSGQTIRLVNSQSNITLAGVYDSEVLPGLVESVSDIIEKFNSLTKFLSVFTPGGGMVLWNKPANQIPIGWAEVVDWRGKLPVGLLPDDVDFSPVGKTGGSRTHTLTQAQLPNVSLQFRTGLEKVGDGNRNGLSRQGGSEFVQDIPLGGNNEAFNILSPYRVVVFIEFIG